MNDFIISVLGNITGLLIFILIVYIIDSKRIKK